MFVEESGGDRRRKRRRRKEKEAEKMEEPEVDGEGGVYLGASMLGPDEGLK